MKDELALEKIERWKELDQEFSYWKPLMKEIRDYILPRRAKFIDDGDTSHGGEKRHDKIIDSTATKAVRTLGSGMHGAHTSSAIRWFKIVPADITMVKISSRVASWLETVEKILYSILARSNFYSVIHSLYEEEAGFGTSVMLMPEDDETLIRFELSTMGEYRIDNDERGYSDTLYRLFYKNTRQLALEFGLDALPTSIRKEYEKQKSTWHKVLHSVEPNGNIRVGYIDKTNKPFSSTYTLYDESFVLRRGGYEECPFIGARWSTIGSEVYGVCPGHDALGHVKELQVITTAKMEAQEKMVRPPMRVPAQFKDVLDTRPDGMTWVDAMDNEAIGPLYNIQYDINGTNNDIIDIRQQIREIFYNDVLAMLSQAPGIQPKTKAEVDALQEEKLVFLGPVLERHFSEVDSRILTRVFNMAVRRRLIPPPPPELAGRPLEIEYISVLAEAQKRIGASAVSNTTAFVTQLGQLIPTAMDKLSVDDTIDIYAETQGAPANMLNDAETVSKIRGARVQQEQMMMQQQMVSTLAQGAKGVKDLAKSPTDEENALTALVGQTPGPVEQAME